MEFKDMSLYEGLVFIHDIKHTGDGDLPKAWSSVLTLSVSLTDCFKKKNKDFFSLLQRTYGLRNRGQRYFEFELTFEEVCYLEILGESYANPPRYEDDASGNTFRVYQKSEYLEQLKQRRLAEYMEMDGRFQHFSIFGNSQLVEVVTFDNPSIRLLGQGFSLDMDDYEPYDG